MTTLTHLGHFIHGELVIEHGDGTIPVVNPADGCEIGVLPQAGDRQLDLAIDAAQRGFSTWSRISAYERSKVLRAGAQLIRERLESLARVMTLEQGKPLGESRHSNGRCAPTLSSGRQRRGGARTAA